MGAGPGIIPRTALLLSLRASCARLCEDIRGHAVFETQEQGISPLTALLLLLHLSCAEYAYYVEGADESNIRSREDWIFVPLHE